MSALLRPVAGDTTWNLLPEIETSGNIFGHRSYWESRVSFEVDTAYQIRHAEGVGSAYDEIASVHAACTHDEKSMKRSRCLPRSTLPHQRCTRPSSAWTKYT